MSGTTTVRPNTFETVVIGTQTWMKYNYNFGGTYPNNSIDNIASYGKLYTWAEAMLISVPGYHLATVTDFTNLILYLGNSSTSGAYLKEVGTTYWQTPNTGADNSSGFSARGSGYNEAAFNLVTRFWTSNEFDATTANYMYLEYDNTNALLTLGAKTDRYSVRLIKD